MIKVERGMLRCFSYMKGIHEISIAQKESDEQHPQLPYIRKNNNGCSRGESDI